MDVASIANLRFRRMMHCNDTAFNKCISQGTQSLSILLCLGQDGPQRGLKNAVFGISCIACLCPQGLELSISSEGHFFLMVTALALAYALPCKSLNLTSLCTRKKRLFCNVVVFSLLFSKVPLHYNRWLGIWPPYYTL